MVIQLTLLVLAHAQPVVAVTVTVPVVPAATAFADDGEIVGVQGAPACVIVRALLPIVTVPVRAVDVGLAVKL
jgi:hypothetical protein